MKKNCLGEEGYPLRRVNFRERLYEKNVIPLPQLRADNNLAHCLAQSRWSGWAAKTVSLPSKKDDSAKGFTILAMQTICSSC